MGNLFKRRSVSTSNQELIFFITAAHHPNVGKFPGPCIRRDSPDRVSKETRFLLRWRDSSKANGW